MASIPSRKFPWVSRFAPLALFAALVLGIFPAEAGAKSKKKGKKEADGGDELAMPFPVGHGGSGVKIPSHDAKGNLQMNFEIGTAFRVDEGHLKMEDLKIETFDDAGKLDMVIEMPESLMDLKTRILTSENPVKIHRSDFEVTGGNLIFNTTTRQGKFSGPVRMLIFNRERLASPDKEKQE